MNEYKRRSSLQSNLHLDPVTIQNANKFQGVVKESLLRPFNVDTHTKLLIAYWKGTFGSEAPGLPSSPQWLDLGFTTHSPLNELKPLGLCTIECLIALTQHSDFYHFLRNSATTSKLPLSIIVGHCIKTCFEMMGWSLEKVEASPRGGLTSLQISLRKLLFEFPKIKIESITNQLAIKSSTLVFQKIVFLTLGTCEAVWTKLQKDSKKEDSAVSLEEVLDKASNEVEGILKVINNNFSLDEYLIENFSLDIIYLQTEQVFQIWLPNSYQSIIYRPDSTLKSHLLKLCEKRGLEFDQYVVYDQNGKKVTDTDITLQAFNQSAIHFYPEGTVPDVTNKRQKGFSVVNSNGTTTMDTTLSNYPTRNARKRAPKPSPHKKLKRKAFLKNKTDYKSPSKLKDTIPSTVSEAQVPPYLAYTRLSLPPHVNSSAYQELYDFQLNLLDPLGHRYQELRNHLTFLHERILLLKEDIDNMQKEDRDISEDFSSEECSFSQSLSYSTSNAGVSIPISINYSTAGTSAVEAPLSVREEAKNITPKKSFASLAPFDGSGGGNATNKKGRTVSGKLTDKGGLLETKTKRKDKDEDSAREKTSARRSVTYDKKEK